MPGKYKSNESHFATRGLAVLGIIILFILHSIIFINPQGRSCLGDPIYLPFAFIGLPLLLILAIVDLVVLAIIKVFTWTKFFINFGILAVLILVVFLIIH